MKANIKSEVRDYKVSNALMPLYEALSNAFYSIEHYHIENGLIKITVMREDTHIDDKKEANIIGFKIEDNGVGFTEQNVDSFDTAGSDLKEKDGGKGKGRFSWLKVFEYATVNSICIDNGSFYQKKFRFDYDFKVENIKRNPTGTNNTGTIVTLNNILNKYKKLLPKKIETIAKNLIIHFMDYFIIDSPIKVVLYDGAEHKVLNDYWKGFVIDQNYNIPKEIQNTEFQYNYIMLSDSLIKESTIVLTACNRQVKDFVINSYISDIDDVFDVDNARLCVWVTSSYLNQCVNSDRNDFDYICEEKERHAKPDEISYENIISPVIEKLKIDFAQKQEILNKEKSERVENFIRTSAPHYMYLLRVKGNLAEKISYIDANDNKKLESKLQDIYQEELKSVKKETLAATENFADGNKDEFIKKVNKIIEEYSCLGQSELARYIAHRKAIIDIFEYYSEALLETNKANIENDLHRIIFPLKRESSDISFEMHNLWLLDERFNFHYLLASDKQFDQIPVLNVDSEDRADIVAILGDVKSGTSSSIFLVEFKRPQKNDYDMMNTKYHPNKQIYRYVSQIRKGNTVASLDDRYKKIIVKADAPAYAVIVADLMPKLEEILKEDGFKKYTNNKGNDYMLKLDGDNKITYVVYPYLTLIDEAKERNRIFFEKLGIN